MAHRLSQEFAIRTSIRAAAKILRWVRWRPNVVLVLISLAGRIPRHSWARGWRNSKGSITPGFYIVRSIFGQVESVGEGVTSVKPVSACVWSVIGV
jgi:NADPH:quinone reductase-like Zn-dependent oxidoreductase